MTIIDPAPEVRPISARPAHGTGGPLGRTGFAWATFEWARNPYYILIVIYIFAPYFARDIIGADLLASGELDGLDPATARATANAQGQATIASVTKWAGLATALTAPFLGAALDRGGRLKPVLAIFLGLIVVCSALLWFAMPGGQGFSTGWIMILLATAYACYTYSEVTHNAMLSVAGGPGKLSMISGLGLGLGNLAATLIFAALVFLFVLPSMVQWPFAKPQFGFDMANFEHMRIAGPICAVWLALFSIPFFLHAKDPGVRGASWPKAIRDGARSVVQTLREAAKYRELMKFLVARMFYQDAMAALLALGAVYVALFLEWGVLEMLCYAIYASAWAFAGGIFGGWLEARVGVKRALVFQIVCMVMAMLVQLSITRESLGFGIIANYQVWDGMVFKTLSDLVYLALISVVAVTATASISGSRTMLVTLAPAGRSGEFFGLYAIAGTITVWMGPLLVEYFTLWSNSQRIGMASISLLFTIGLAILVTVKMPHENAA
ncbi:MFS transporter [Parerythrobacter lacustris]|uniref:MFS transporter n=1 Tax=Parerythrobacter lacustris TaxID=2969984 RepID=A0ABT1XSQ8_9SPHN|nr:MFS transporter [Parerythrobacter lacustris]MCR2834642.1 MFS transporter [Parerythrobacter lacustris]